MIIHLSKYRNVKPGLIKMYSNMVHEHDLVRRIVQVGVATHVPLIAVTSYVLEEFGSNPELEDSLQKLICFYKILEVKE